MIWQTASLGFCHRPPHSTRDTGFCVAAGLTKLCKIQQIYDLALPF